MKRNFTLKLSSFLVVAATLSASSFAQYGIAPKFDQAGGSAVTPTNYHRDYLNKSRVMVDEPASLAGIKVYRASNEGNTGDWGGALTGVWNGVQLVRVTDSLACPGTITNGAAVSGKWAFIYRGDCEFSQKALACQQAGAQGVIMVNNVAGEGPQGMGPGSQSASVTIPVIMLSKEDGDAINNELKNNVTVKMSISSWGLSNSQDLAFIPGGTVLWNSFAVPKTQLGSTNGNPAVFKHQTGAFIGNFGTTNATNVKIKNVTTFTPTGGTPSVVFSDSVTIPSFNAADSIMYGYTQTNTDIHATGTGLLQSAYTLSSSLTDQYPADNSITTVSYVTDSLYTKARYNFVKNEPISTIGYRYANPAASEYLWGPIFRITKGGYSFRKIQFTVSNGNTASPQLTGNNMVFFIWKWVDDGDNRAVASELTAVGTAAITFGATDTSGNFFTIPVESGSEPGKPMLTEDNSVYWVTASVPSTWFLGVDGIVNYYPRFFIRQEQTAKVHEPFGASYNGSVGDVLDGATAVNISMMPFESYFVGDSSRFSQQINGLVPSIAVHMSTYDMTAVPASPTNFSSIAVYPNPATDLLNINVKFEKPANQVHYRVVDGLGRTIHKESKDNVLDDRFTLATGNYAAGNYYLVITADDHTTMKKFTIIAK